MNNGCTNTFYRIYSKSYYSLNKNLLKFSFIKLVNSLVSIFFFLKTNENYFFQTNWFILTNEAVNYIHFSCISKKPRSLSKSEKPYSRM